MPTWLDDILRGAARLISSRGTSLPTRTSLNFAAPLVATDNSGSDRTDVTVDATVSTGPGASAAGELAAYADTSGAALARTYISASVPLAGARQLAPTTAGETLVLAGGDAPGATGGHVLILAGDGTTKGYAAIFDLPAAGYGAEKWVWVADGRTTPTDASTDGAWLGSVGGKLHTVSHADGLGQLLRSQPGDTFADNQLCRFVGSGGRKMRATSVTADDDGTVNVVDGQGIDAPSGELVVGATATLITLTAEVETGGDVTVPTGKGIDSAGDLFVGATATTVNVGNGASTTTVDGDVELIGSTLDANGVDGTFASVSAATVTATGPQNALEAISNCVAWWRADRGVTSDVNGVSVWTDSISSRTLSQSTNSYKPAVSTLRGQAALSFAGGDWLASDEAAANWVGLHNGSGSTIAVVMRYNDPALAHGPVLDTSDSQITGLATTHGISLYVYAGGTTLNYANSRGNATPATAATGKQLHYIANHLAIIRSKTGGSPNECAYYDNGRHFLSAFGGAASASNPSYTLHVGCNPNSKAYTLVGLVAEIIIWSRYLTDAEIDKVETYIAERYRMPFFSGA